MPWASPEVILEPATADARADVFSLARIVGWLVSGVVPEVNQPSYVSPESEWYGFVKAGTARARDDRPASIADLLLLMPEAPSPDPKPDESAVRDPLEPVELPFEFLWTVHIEQGVANGLYVAYRAKGSEAVSKALTESIPVIRRDDLPAAAQGAADEIAQYVLGIMPEPAHHRDGGAVLRPERTREHASHAVTERPEVLTWTRETFFPGGAYEAPTRDLPIAALNVSLQECVAILDAEAARRARACFERLREERLTPQR
jgi:hypothetical protein